MAEATAQIGGSVRVQQYARTASVARSYADGLY
jgi:hypothetical protein